MYTETQHPRVEGDEEAGSKAATTGHVVSGQGKCFHSDHVCQDLHTSTKHPGPLWGRLASCACPPSGCPGPPQRMCSWHCARVSSAYFWVCVWKELCAGMGVRVQTLCLDVCPSEIPQQFSQWTLRPCFPVLPSPCWLLLYSLCLFHGNPYLRGLNPLIFYPKAPFLFTSDSLF